MSHRLLATTAVVLLLSLSPFTQAQQASAPAAATTPAAPASPAPEAKAASTDTAEGKVAYYGRKFAGRKTASGERFNPNALTMAHKALPMGTMVRVTNLKNNKSVVVRVNDRGPSTPDRVGDLSHAAASKISMLRSGVVQARLEVLGKAKARKSKKA
jgi:rare lipoprotein A